MDTPNFQGRQLWERLIWAKKNLKPYQSEYCVVYEDSVDEPALVLFPDPNWMSCAMQGGVLPPVEIYLELAKDEAQPDFNRHTRGYLLHDTKPVGPMTEKESIEYLIMKDVPKHVWQGWNAGNKPKIVICRKEQLPSTEEWRKAWKISDELTFNSAAAQELKMSQLYIMDKDGNVADADTLTIPSDEHFRDAWLLSGSIISEDVEVAKAIFKDKVREVRGPLLDAEDVVYMKALETDDADAKAVSVAKKTALRDAPANSSIDAATDITTLKACWDTDLLGSSPY